MYGTMPHRGIRATIQPKFNFSSVLKTLDNLPKPLTVQSLFHTDAPLELEIGSGKGMFLCKAAEAFPNRRFLGIEVSKKYAHRCAAALWRKRLHKDNLLSWWKRLWYLLKPSPFTNAVVVNGDAALVLRDWIPDNTLAAVHIYFPDPWWKRAHRKRRILRTDVVQLIERRLQSGGSLHFWTDVEEYFLAAQKLLTKETHLLGPFDVPESDNNDYQTHFERRTRLCGETVYRTRWDKR